MKAEIVMKNTSSDQPKLDCFKVQLDATGTNIIIYNEDHSFVGSTSDAGIISDFRTLFGLEPATKKYITGYIDADNAFNFDEVVPDQDW